MLQMKKIQLPPLLKKGIEETPPRRPRRPLIIKNTESCSLDETQFILKSNSSSFHDSDFNMHIEEISEDW